MKKIAFSYPTIVTPLTTHGICF